MKHYTEEALIAYHLNESSDARAISTHLESCPECATLSDSIAETLRVFSAAPVTIPSIDRSWERVRGNLTVLEPAPRRFNIFGKAIIWPAAGLVTAALTVFAIFGTHTNVKHPNFSFNRHVNTAINGHGPLTTEPEDPAIAAHLDSAERLLTEVNHTNGAIDATTRSHAHDLLLKNAVYTTSARDRGDLTEAAVLDNLGRVLTSIDTDPPENQHSTWQLRIAMNTDGLLFDLRVLRQNDQK